MITSAFAVTLVLVLILLTNEGARVLSRAADNQYPRDMVIELIGLGALQHLPILVPIGLLLGMVMAFGRLYHDSEMTAALACGVGMARVYAPVISVGIVVAAVLAWLSLSVGPASMAKVLTLRSAAFHAGQFAPVAPGRFRSFGGGRTVVYAQNALPDGTLSNVFVERERDGRVEVALAQRARHAVATDGQSLTITLYDGERIEGVPGSPQYRIMKFAEHTIPVQMPPLRDAPGDLDAAPTQELLGTAALDRRAQLQWRIALPIMSLVLAVLAVPISRMRPRRGRLSRVWLAVLLYIFYFYLLSAGRIGIEHGSIPAALGLWWVHVVVIVTVLVITQLPEWLSRVRHTRIGPRAGTESGMNILDRYIVTRILSMTALVMIVIIGLAVLFTFIAEQGDTGTGHYGSLDALWFSLMSLPQQAWELLPIGALIGSMLGLGSLASGSELTVARAAGISVARLALSVFIAGVVLVGIEVVLGELLAPPLQQVARQQKAFERFSDASFGGGSAWVRDGNQILDVEQSQDGKPHGGMLIFELSADHHLLAEGRAARALPGAGHRWELHGYAESRFGADGQVKAFSEGVRTLDSNVTGRFLHLAMSEPGELASGALWSLIRYYRANSLDPKPYLFAFWSRIARTGAIAFAVLLAIPFVLGPMRSSNTGTRLLAGLLLGLGFFFMQRFIESGTIVFDLNPVVLAWLPTAVLMVVTLGLLARVR